MKAETLQKQYKQFEGLIGVCAPIALWVVCKKKNTLKVCTKHGWTEKGGMHDDQWQAAAKELGIKLKKIKFTGSVNKFLKEYPYKQYIISTYAHIFVIKNGQMIDLRYKRNGLYRTILGVWEVK